MSILRNSHGKGVAGDRAAYLTAAELDRAEGKQAMRGGRAKCGPSYRRIHKRHTRGHMSTFPRRRAG